MKSADQRGWGKGWPQNNAAKMVTVKAALSGTSWSVHREVAPILKFVVDEVERRGYLFDHGPADQLDDWGYANRPIRGTRTPSNHSWGLAIDADATLYPQGQSKARFPQWVMDVFATYGWENGWRWSNPDPMHFEYSGTPADARWLVAALAAHHIDGTPPPVPTGTPAPTPIPQGDDDMAILVQSKNANPDDPFTTKNIFRVTATTYFLCTPDDVTVHQELAPITGDDPKVHLIDAPKMRSIMRTREKRAA